MYTASLIAIICLFATAIAPIVQAAPRPLLRRDDAPTPNYSSKLYEWVLVPQDKDYSSWDSYKGYNLVKAEYPDQDGIYAYACLVKMVDGTYRIGHFDATSVFTCIVVYDSASLAVTAKYETYFLSTAQECTAHWTLYNDLKEYSEDNLVYAPDHDCVTSQVCLPTSKTSEEYKPPSGEKSDQWYPHKRSWTRTLGRRADGYGKDEPYCYIGYGSTGTDYKVFFAYGDKAYQSDDVRYSSDVKILIVTEDSEETKDSA